MPTVFVESADEFIRRHGSDPINLSVTAAGQRHDSTRLLLADGAQIDMDDPRIRREPPTDPAQRLAWEIKYLELALGCQSYIGGQAPIHAAGAGPPPHPDAYEDLKRFQASYREIQGQLKAKQEELLALRGPSEWDRRQAERAEQRATAQKALADMAAIVGNPPPADNGQAKVSEVIRETNRAIGRAMLKKVGIRPADLQKGT